MVNGILSISDYSHWNEDAALMWYEENKYDMTHPEVFEDDFNEDFYYDDSEIPEDKCFELYKHQMNTSGMSGEFMGQEIYIAQNCDDCGISLSSLWRYPR
jgi:hypothetical protein